MIFMTKAGSGCFAAEEILMLLFGYVGGRTPFSSHPFNICDVWALNEERLSRRASESLYAGAT